MREVGGGEVSEVNIIVNSTDVLFDVYSKLYKKNYNVLITTTKNKFLTDKIPTEVKGNYYFKNCNIHRVSGERISEEYIGGDVVEIEVKKIDLSGVLQ